MSDLPPDLRRRLEDNLEEMGEEDSGDWADRLVAALSLLPDEIYAIPRGNLNPYRVQLTNHEKRVLEYLSHGLTYEMVAAAMCISRETVKTTISRIRYVLRAKNSNHAIAIAIRNGVIR